MASSLIYVGEKKDWIDHHSSLKVFKRDKNFFLNFLRSISYPNKM
jgi:hypothetical protein